jgi:hypothetical protein
MARDRLPARRFRGGVLPYLLAGVVVAVATPPVAAAQAHAHPQAHAHRATIVRLTSLDLETPTPDSVQVVVWASGPARVGVGNADPTPLADTLRLSSLPSITADVSQGDVHIRLLSPGRMRLGGEVSGGRAIRFTATGRHVVILKGGVGADTITDP